MHPLARPAIRALSIAVLAASTACGSTVVDDSTTTTSSAGPSTTATSSASASSGSSGPGTGTAASSGSTGDPAGSGGDGPASVGSTGEGAGDPVGNGGGGGDPGSGGAAPAGACVDLAYCDCAAGEACQVVAEDCFCPCGVEPCEPPCRCDCAGGAYLGCAPASILQPGALDEGVWLIGWAGGTNHYSWVRFEPGGALTMLDGAGIATNIPYWECNGPGSWVLAATPETVVVQMAGDGGSCAFSPLTFGPWLGDPAWPEGARQAVTVLDGANPDVPLTAYRFPDAQCAPDLSRCADPLGF
jgi:hypothetical protein